MGSVHLKRVIAYSFNHTTGDFNVVLTTTNDGLNLARSCDSRVPHNGLVCADSTHGVALKAGSFDLPYTVYSTYDMRRRAKHMASQISRRETARTANTTLGRTRTAKDKHSGGSWHCNSFR